MKIKHFSNRLKKGFTLIELVAVMLATSILFTGFTAFTVFFMNQYNYEMDLNKFENSASQLKYSISNNVDKFNYTFEKSIDFIKPSVKIGEYENGEIKLFQTVTPVEQFSNPELNYYTGVIIRDYKFVLETADSKAYFGYTETVYTFKQSVQLLPSQREATLRNHISNATPSAPENYIIYQSLSKMILEYQKVKDVTTSCAKYQFTIQYDFASDVSDTGTKQLIFDKYIYFVN